MLIVKPVIIDPWLAESTLTRTGKRRSAAVITSRGLPGIFEFRICSRRRTITRLPIPVEPVLKCSRTPLGSDAVCSTVVS
jgi:hypothetical protein